MAWADFTGDFDHRIEHHTTTEFLAGMRCSVTRDCLNQAVALGKAREIRTPSAAIRAQLVADPYWRPETSAHADDPRPDRPRHLPAAQRAGQ